MSSASTPAPSGMPIESRNYVHTPRPFKKAGNGKTSNKRTRTLKQILAAERDFVLGLDQPASKKAGGSHQKGAAGGSKRLLTGAAAAAARRREEQLANESGAVTPAGETDDQDGDTTMASATGTSGVQTPALVGGVTSALDAETEAMLKRRRALPTYASIEAPPSLRPRKKFCDVTGLIAPYTDPKTRLRYHSVEIYEIIKTFGPGVDQTYLSLRGEATQIK